MPWRSVLVSPVSVHPSTTQTSETLTKVPAKPFLRPALDDNENAVLSRYRRELARGIERVGKKMGRRSR